MGRMTSIFAFMLLTAALPGADSMGPAQRRDVLLKNAEGGDLAAFVAALSDENLVVRRTAARLLARMGPSAESALAKAFENDDPLVRRTALRALCRFKAEQALAWAKRGLTDHDAAVRRLAVDWCVGQPRTEGITGMLVGLRADADPAIRDAVRAALFPFQRENISLRNRKDYDHDVRVAQSVPLPEDGWWFRPDAQDGGHLKKWFEGDAAHDGWTSIRVGKSWESQGHKYDGVAWYRLTFKMPAKPTKFTAVDLAFDGVDEAAWIWLNGEFIGSHDIGKAGWNRPFQLDVTKETRWGAENHLVVRVFDSASAGGIWKPVRVEILE